jgi:hypothetical protein
MCFRIARLTCIVQGARPMHVRHIEAALLEAASVTDGRGTFPQCIVRLTCIVQGARPMHVRHQPPCSRRRPSQTGGTHVCIIGARRMMHRRASHDYDKACCHCMLPNFVMLRYYVKSCSIASRGSSCIGRPRSWLQASFSCRLREAHRTKIRRPFHAMSHEHREHMGSSHVFY